MGNYNSVINEKPTKYETKEIEILFENKNNEISIGDEVGEYYSHPAFQAFDTNGIWVAKFETSGTINEIKIKPNNIPIKQMLKLFSKSHLTIKKKIHHI
jgi:hypothetical protein